MSQKKHKKLRGFGHTSTSFTNSNKMTNTLTVDKSHEELMEEMMFASHTTKIWVYLFHYYKMGGLFSDLCFTQWMFDGVPKEYIAPPDNIEVMHNMRDFHKFRQTMITHLYKEYVENWCSDDE